jgi:hypothetical protein
MKQEYARGLFLYQPLQRIEANLEKYAWWFNTERPHQGLGNRSPDEVHDERRHPPPQRAPGSATIAVRFLGNDRALPILRLRRAA